MAEENSVLRNHFLKMFRYIKWSNIRILELLKSENISSGKEVELISHIVIAEETWYKRISNETYENKFWNILSLDDCKKLEAETNTKFIKYISSLSEEDFKKKLAYTSSRGVDFETSIEDILTQIGLHGMYHRGQIMLLMRNSGKETIATDYAMYMRENESGQK
ncbi:MAG: DinB family protein [Ignavibacteriaceae bacterium]|nr:DinB family protein [Ignavibacteriaceae bacterium]